MTFERMPPGKAHEIGKEVVSNGDHDKNPQDIPSTPIKGEFWHITKQEGSDVKELGKLER